MDLLGWLVVAGIVAFPVLSANAYREHRRGDRTRESLSRGVGLAAIGTSILLQRAATRWFRTPVDDAIAVLSLVALGGGLYAMYVGYGRERGADATSGD